MNTSVLNRMTGEELLLVRLFDTRPGVRDAVDAVLDRRALQPRGARPSRTERPGEVDGRRGDRIYQAA